MKSFLIIILYALFATSCSDSGVRPPVTNSDKGVKRLVESISELELYLRDDLILNSSTAQEKSELSNILKDLKILTFKLKQSPLQKNITLEAFKLFKKVESFPFSDRDAGLFEELLQELRFFISKHADLQNLSLEGLEWSLLKLQFVNSLKPFQSLKYFSDSKEWEFGSYRSDRYAKIESRNTPTDAWLFSPKLSLTGGRNYSLVIKHIVRNPEWKYFKMLISTDYNGMDPLEATWTELEIEPTSSVQSNQWTTLFSNKIDLSEFKGKEVVIAFHYQADIESNSVWEVLEVDIKGTGQAVGIKALEIDYDANNTEDVNL